MKAPVRPARRHTPPMRKSLHKFIHFKKQVLNLLATHKMTSGAVVVKPDSISAAHGHGGSK